MRSWQGICLSAVVLVVFASAGHAQSVTPDVEYKKLIQVNQGIQPLGAHPFGEQVDLSTGELSFEEPDVSLPGNGPLLLLSRSLGTTSAVGNFNAERPFADWDLGIPRIETTTANQGGVTGWEVEAANPLQRCTYFGAPPDVPGGTITSADTWSSDQWWYGYHLIVPGEGSQTLLAGGNSLTPTIGGQTFWIATKQNWVIGCGVTADDGGEGFLALAPDGTRYTFAHLFYRPLTNITKPGGTPPDGVTAFSSGSVQPQVIVGGTDSLARREAFMYVTQVQDRFGNTLNYHYDASTGYLTSITASDGREVDVTYVSGSPLIHSITAKAANVTARTWTYSYDTTTQPVLPTLTGVTLPDGSAWSYNLAGFQSDFIQVASANCNLNQVGSVTATTTTGTITTPSGLYGSFAEVPMLHGRSYVPKSCWGGLNPPQQVYFLIPSANYQQSITSETLTGAGLPTETWSYSYSPANQSWKTDSCASTSSCPSTVYTDVTDPDGNDTRYTFSNVFDATEGQLKETDYYSGAASGTVMRSVANSYANPTDGPWPTSYGIDWQGRDNYLQTQEGAPLQQRTTAQDGSNFIWQALAFNAYAQPTDVARSNNITGQLPLEETTTYRNDPNLWVLGLPLQVTNVTPVAGVPTNEVESTNTYAGNDTLLTRARFGQPLMSYTFNGAGQLASFTDGDTHTTSLSNYKRGIPQTISYPDSTSESLVVDDLGQIASITDQAGHTTSYSYDQVGRITGINYPGGDEVAWTPETFSYSFVASAERGLAANHWKRTTTTGNAVAVTYFDAMLRPVLSDSDIGSTVQASTLSTYDSKGQKLFSAYPSATALTFTQSPTVAGSTTTYDALGRVTQVQQTSELGALISSTAYVSGAGQQVTDPKGNVTTTSYQVFDEPSYNAVTQVQAPAGITQTIARDIYGNPQSITQSGPGTNPVIKSLVYDSYHRLCRTTEPESGSEVMNYDAANNLAWSASGLTITGTGCGQEQVATAAQTTRTYDAMNRVKTLLPPAGTQSTSYGYDSVGRLTSAVSGTTTWNGTYNFRGMLTGESEQLVGQNPWAIGYAHDANGHTSLIHYPDGENVSYTPDALGRPTQVGSYASSIGYFPNGQVSQFVYGNGSGYVASQNARQLLSNFSYGPGSTAQLSEDLAYDNNSNITTVTDLVAGGPRNKSFGYDALNRLTSATAAGLWGTQTYTYDAVNNLRTLQTDSQVSTYTYDTSNKLTSISGATPVSYTYDPRGNVATKNSTTLVFDQKNQLTQVVGADTYAYDAAGRRVTKTVGSTTTDYFYNQAGQLMYQAEPAATRGTKFIYLGTKLIAKNVIDTTILTPSEVNVTLSLVSAPSLSADGQQISATVDIRNQGTVTLTSSGSHPVNLGDHLVDASGRILVNDITRAAIPDIPPGSHAAVTISLPSTSGALGTGEFVQFIPVQEGVAWFNSFGTVPITVGTFVTPTVPATSSNGSYSVSWAGISGAVSYTLQEQINAGAWATVQATSATSKAFTGKSTAIYGYRVQACAASGCGPWSNVASTSVILPPPVPASITVPATSTGSVAVSWAASATATSYTLQHRLSAGSWAAAYSGAATSSTVTETATGSYTYQVEACNAGGCSAFKLSSAVTVTIPPSTASSLSVPATSYTGSYTVSWGAVAAATSYTLQEQVNAGAWTTILTANALSDALSGKGTASYGYRVQGCNAGGCGPWSATANTTVLLPPAAPATITVPATSSGSVAVGWEASSTATSYTLQHRLGTGSWATVYSGAATSSTVTEIATGSYTYQVEACNAGGCSAFKLSSAVTVTIPPANAPSLSVPTSSSTGSYTMSWSAVSGATSYTLQEQINGGGWTTIQATSATSKALSGKGNGSYGYRVQACNAGGCGPWSSTGAIVVTFPPSAPPTYLSAPSSADYPDGSWLVSWPAVSSATSYTLQRTNTGTSIVSTVYTGAATSASDGGIAVPPGTYMYAVKACNVGGCSGWQNSQSMVVTCTNSQIAEKQGAATPDIIKCNTSAVVREGDQP